MERKRFRKILLGAAAFIGGAGAIGGVTYLVVEGEGGQNGEQVFNPNSPQTTRTMDGTVIAGIEPTPTPTPTRIPGSTGEFTPTPTLAPTPEPTDLWAPPGTIWVTPTPTEPPIWTPKPTQPPVYPTPTPVRTPEPTIRPTAPPTPEPTPTIVEGLNYEWSNQLFSLINQARVENGLDPLSYNDALTRAAQKYTEFLFNNGNLYGVPDHNLDGTPQERAEREGYSGGVGEILDVDQISAYNVIQDWLASPGHRDIILLDYIKDVGFGCYQGPIVLPHGETIRVVVCAGEVGVPNS